MKLFKHHSSAYVVTELSMIVDITTIVIIIVVIIVIVTMHTNKSQRHPMSPITV